MVSGTKVSGQFGEDVIGFSCGYAGSPTESVVLIDKLVERKNYDELLRVLNYDDKGVKCLAVIICELLELKEKIKLTIENKERIRDVYNCKEKICICSGCAQYQEMTISDIVQGLHI